MDESICKTDTADRVQNNTPSPQEDEIFRTHSSTDIRFILREIAHRNTLVTLYFDQSHRFILTSILAIEEKNDEMLIDYGAETKFNELALKSTALTFVTTQNRIKIEFTCHQIRRTQYEHRDVFAVRLPESLVRMQRRNDYRLLTPIINPLKCIIPVSAGEIPVKAEIVIIDMSCGGIGVIDHHPVISFEPGIRYHNCQLDLPEFGSITATIEVRTAYEIRLKNGQKCRRAGCQFINLPIDMEAMIQRYITRQEQKRITP